MRGIAKRGIGGGEEEDNEFRKERGREVGRDRGKVRCKVQRVKYNHEDD